MKRVGPGGVFAALVAAVLIGVSGGFGLRVGFGQPQWHDEVLGRLWPQSSAAPTNGSSGPGTQPVGNSSTSLPNDALKWLVQLNDLGETPVATQGTGTSPTQLNACMQEPITSVSGNAPSAWVRFTWSGGPESFTEQVAEAPDAETAQAWAQQLYEWHATCRGNATSDISRPPIIGGSATIVTVPVSDQLVATSIVMRVIDRVAVGYYVAGPTEGDALDPVISAMATRLSVQ